MRESLKSYKSKKTEVENHENHLPESISAANCSHGLLHFVQGMALDGLQRCDKMIQALAYYNLEASKYLLSATKGAAQGIAGVEIAALTMQAIGSAASTCAPALTATISSAVSAAAAPIACAAGVLAATAIVGEAGRLGYFYATDQLTEIDADYHKIKDFAAKFYDFNQTSYEHVENISQAATTLLWPVKAQTIIDSLQGIQKAQVNFYVQGKKVVEQTVRVSNEMLEKALSKVNSFEFQEFNAMYKKIFNQHIFEFSAPPQVALAGISENFIEQEIASLIPTTHLLNEQANKVTEKVVAVVVNQVSQDIIGQQIGNEVELVVTEQATKQITQDFTRFENAMNFIQNAPKIDPKRFEIFMQAEFVVPGIEQYPDIRQLAALSTKTQNFTNVSSLTKAEIYYVNKIHYAQQANNYTKAFIETIKPTITFVNPDTNIESVYQVKGIAFNHVHIGEYGGRKNPNGCHCMPEYLANETFNPIFIKDGPHGTKYITIHNPINPDKYNKDTSIYPIDWSHEKCDMKMFEALLGEKLFIEKDKQRVNVLNIIGFTKQGMEIWIHYNIDTGIITSHYPFIEI